VSKRAEIRRSLKEENLYFKEYINFLEAALDAMAVVIKDCRLCKKCEGRVQKVFDEFGIRMEDDNNGEDSLPKLLS